jgi:hypothetical protein
LKENFAYGRMRHDLSERKRERDPQQMTEGMRSSRTSRPIHYHLAILAFRTRIQLTSGSSNQTLPAVSPRVVHDLLLPLLAVLFHPLATPSSDDGLETCFLPCNSTFTSSTTTKEHILFIPSTFSRHLSSLSIHSCLHPLLPQLCRLFLLPSPSSAPASRLSPLHIALQLSHRTPKSLSSMPRSKSAVG